MRHAGIHLAFNGRRHRIDMAELTGGRAITIYGQNEVVKDLIEARLRSGRPLHFEVGGVTPARLTDDTPVVSFTQDGEQHELLCDFVAGCDGFHGVCRTVIPSPHLTAYEREYPFGWLGILAHARALVRRARLQQPPAGLRALQHALAAGDAALSAVRTR